MDEIFPAQETEDPGKDPAFLKRVIATLAQQAGGEIRLSKLVDRAQLALFRDDDRREWVIQVNNVPWPRRED